MKNEFAGTGEYFLICSAVQLTVLTLTSSSTWHQKSGVAPRKPEDRTCSGSMKPTGRIIMIIFQYYYSFKNRIFNYLEGTFPWKYNISTSITFSVKFRLTYRFRTFVLKCCYKCTAWFSKFWSRFEHSNPPVTLSRYVRWMTHALNQNHYQLWIFKIKINSISSDCENHF